MITENLKKLNTVDIYSLILFAMYKMKDIPSYRTLSELMYVLDKNSFLRLCEYFGGKELTIPTLEDLEVSLYTLLVYDDVVNNSADFEECLGNLQISKETKKSVRELYPQLAEVLKNYEFTPR